MSLNTSPPTLKWVELISLNKVRGSPGLAPVMDSVSRLYEFNPCRGWGQYFMLLLFHRVVVGGGSLGPWVAPMVIERFDPLWGQVCVYISAVHFGVS